MSHNDCVRTAARIFIAPWYIASMTHVLDAQQQRPAIDRHFHKLTHSACAPLQQAAVDMADFATAAGTPLIRFTDQNADVHPAFEYPALIVHTAKQCVLDAVDAAPARHPPKVLLWTGRKDKRRFGSLQSTCDSSMVIEALCALAHANSGNSLSALQMQACGSCCPPCQCGPWMLFNDVTRFEQGAAATPEQAAAAVAAAAANTPHSEEPDCEVETLHTLAGVPRLRFRGTDDLDALEGAILRAHVNVTTHPVPTPAQQLVSASGHLLVALAPAAGRRDRGIAGLRAAGAACCPVPPAGRGC